MQINKSEMRMIQNALFFFAMMVEDKQPKVGKKYRLLSEKFPSSASLLTPLAIDGGGAVPLQAESAPEVLSIGEADTTTPSTSKEPR